MRSNGIFGGGNGRSRNRNEFVSMEAIEKQLKNPGLRTDNYADKLSEKERIAKSALDAITSGKAIDLRDFDEDEQAYLLQLSAMVSNGAISEYKSEIQGYNENYITNINSPIALETILSTISAYDKRDGNITNKLKIEYLILCFKIMGTT